MPAVQRLNTQERLSTECGTSNVFLHNIIQSCLKHKYESFKCDWVLMFVYTEIQSQSHIITQSNQINNYLFLMGLSLNVLYMPDEGSETETLLIKLWYLFASTENVWELLVFCVLC